MVRSRTRWRGPTRPSAGSLTSQVSVSAVSGGRTVRSTARCRARKPATTGPDHASSTPSNSTAPVPRPVCQKSGVRPSTRVAPHADHRPRCSGCPGSVVVGDDAPGRGPQRMQVAAASDTGPGLSGERHGRLRLVAGDGPAVDREVDAVETLARHDGPDDRAIERRLEPQPPHLARRQLADREGDRPIAHQLRHDRLAVVLAADDEALADHARGQRHRDDGFADGGLAVGDDDGGQPARAALKRARCPP